MTAEERRRPGGRTSWTAAAVLVWAVLLGTVCVRGLCQPGAHNCYAVFYEPAGRNWLSGRDLYETPTKTCRYSPLVNACYAPLSLTPSWAGGLIWRLVLAAGFLGPLSWWLRVYAPPVWPPAYRTYLFLLIVPLSIGNINSAQANPLVIGLMLAGIAAAGEERWNLAAAFLAGACLFKIYPIALALILAAAYPRRFAARFLTALAAGLALPFVLQNPWWVARQYANWGDNLRADDRAGWDLVDGYRDLWLLIRSGHLPVSRSMYVGIQLALAALAAAPCLAGRWIAGWPRKEVLNAALGLAVCWMTLCGPATEGATYILLAPTLAWALLESWNGGWTVWARALLLAGCAAFVAAMPGCLTPRAAQWTVYGQQPAGAALVFAALLAERLRRFAAPAPSADCGATIRSAAA